jgi:hypothetical protein
VEDLKKRCAQTLKPIDGHLAFRIFNAFAILASAYTSEEYCRGVAVLFPRACNNPDLKYVKWAITLLGAQTVLGSQLAAVLAIGVFATIHSITGFTMPRDYAIAIYQTPRCTLKVLTFLMGATTLGWAALTGATAMVESDNLIGAFKGASVNAVGTQALVVLLVGKMLIPIAQGASSCIRKIPESTCFRGANSFNPLENLMEAKPR